REPRRGHLPREGTAARAERQGRGHEEAQARGGRGGPQGPAPHDPRSREGAPGGRGGKEALRRQGVPRRRDRLPHGGGGRERGRPLLYREGGGTGPGDRGRLRGEPG